MPIDPRIWTADSEDVTADSLLTVDAFLDRSRVTIWTYENIAGLVCDLLDRPVPSVTDILSDVSTDRLLPQILADTPRGAAWGTDEAGDGRGASPLLRGLWRTIAGVAADAYRAAFDTAVQCFPSAISLSLEDWERDLGLPDACSSRLGGAPDRIAAVRAKYAAQGGSSPGYFICVARSLGYPISIEEPEAFRCDESECGGPDEVALIGLDAIWIIRILGYRETWFYPDDGRVDETPLEGYVPADDLECLFRRIAPKHTQMIFLY